MTHFLQRVRWARHRTHAESSKNLWQLAADSLPSPGTHLITLRHNYNHHGIYVGDGKVMHYAGLCESLHRGPVQEVSIARFAASQEIWVKPTPLPRYVGEETVQRERSRLGENHYRLLTNNCEHFCTWCLYSQSYSEQVEECLVCPRMAHAYNDIVCSRHFSKQDQKSCIFTFALPTASSRLFAAAVQISTSLNDREKSIITAN